MKKVVIIGGGPAGISASLYLARSNKFEVTVISHQESALRKAELIENYFGFAEPISGEELLNNGIAGAKRLGVQFEQAQVLEVLLTADMGFEVTTTKDTCRYDSVLIATGAKRAKPSFKGVTEFEGKGVSYCAVCDAFFYRGKPVVVVGSGEYALHEAMTLSHTASSVTILTDGIQPRFTLPDNISCCEKKIGRLSGEGTLRQVVFADGSAIDAAGAFMAIGTAGSADLARKIGAAVDGNTIIADENRATNVPGLFAAGDCIGGLLQVSKAVADGAIAAMSIIRTIK